MRRPGLFLHFWSTVAMATLAISLCQEATAASKVKLRGYITSLPDASSVAILDDVIQFVSTTKFELQNSSGAFGPAQLAVGQLIEAEGTWSGKHRFHAEKINSDAAQLSKEIKETAYLEYELDPASATKLEADGEWLFVGERTRSNWLHETAPVSPASGVSSSASVTKFAGRQIEYEGVRREDGLIALSKLELGSFAPPDAYKNPHSIQFMPGKDEKTGIRILEVRKGDKVQGRIKLFSVPEVQEYIHKLGLSLLPPSSALTSRALEFRFFVVEDPNINASALPDGTVLVNTGLLGAVENEAQLAFVLSHEIAHTLQAHMWREVHETRPQRILLMAAALAGAAYVGDVALFLGNIGIEAVVNGHQRRYENQADRMGVQNMIQKGYDPREAPRFSQIIIEHYGSRSSSKIWSDHDAMLLRGSFLATQIKRQYPQQDFGGLKVGSPSFEAMREAMGPVKIN